MARLNPDERASPIQSAAIFRLVYSWTQPLPSKPPTRPPTLLQQEINAWVNEGGRGDDQGP